MSVPTNQPGIVPSLHHIAIQTNDLDNCLAWYQDFLGFSRSWSLTSFSELTRRRLPGVQRLVEVRLGDIRLHVFDRDGVQGRPRPEETPCFQHVCFVVDEPAELTRLRARWVELRGSGRYGFARHDPPTEIVEEPDGTRTFYAFDVNGLELEFSCHPDAES